MVSQAQALPPMPDYLLAPGPVAQVHFELTPSQTQTVSVANEAYGTNSGELLLTALLLVLEKELGRDAWVVELEGHGRQGFEQGPAGDLNVSRTVGWFTSLYPVLLAVDAQAGLSRTVKLVKEQIRLVPDKGLGYGVLRYLSEDGAALALQPQVSFNYLGEFGQKEAAPASALGVGLVVVDEATPDEASVPGLSEGCFLAVSGAVVAGCLQVQVRYRSAAFTPAGITAFRQAFDAQLMTLVAHCVAQPTRAFTPSDFGNTQLSLDQFEHLAHHYPMIRDVYGLSPMQEGILFHALLDTSPSAYVNQISYRLTGQLEARRVEQSLQLLIDRHEVLRTLFDDKTADTPVQVVLNERKADFRYHDLRKQTPDQQATFVATYQEQDRQRGFILHREVLLRLSLLQLADNQYELIWTHHHILMDGWCAGLLLTEYTHLYAQLSQGRTPQLPPPVPYRRYIDWLGRQDVATSLAYWQHYLAGYDQPANLPAHPNGGGSAVAGYEVGELDFALSAPQTRGLVALAGAA
ncbi:condensation domain-containing protein, partial [Fibrella aquatilis]|uniref:condensation domain-containing protein n=1 Tax=Fibrella aquatilis TaxID=2817059 RepID=UPI00286EAD9E